MGNRIKSKYIKHSTLSDDIIVQFRLTLTRGDFGRAIMGSLPQNIREMAIQEIRKYKKEYNKRYMKTLKDNLTLYDEYLKKKRVLHKKYRINNLDKVRLWSARNREKVKRDPVKYNKFKKYMREYQRKYMPIYLANLKANNPKKYEEYKKCWRDNARRYNAAKNW